jgi:hypothetical protein
VSRLAEHAYGRGSLESECGEDTEQLVRVGDGELGVGMHGTRRNRIAVLSRTRRS